MSRKGFIVMALVLSAMVACVLVGPANAAIGIYKWSAAADAQQNTATIQYFLNTDAVGGSVLIKDNTGTVINTIDLAGKLTKGTTYNVTWDGSTSAGANAPTGTYSAVVTVSAAAVTGTQSVKMWANNTANAYGVAVDNNPANSTFGQVYVSRSSSTDKHIDVFDAAGNLLKTIVTGWPTANGSCPWGLAVGINGRVYAGNRSGTAVGNFDPISGAGIRASVGVYLIGCTPAIALNDLGGGSYSDAAMYFMDNNSNLSTGNHVRRILVDGSYAFGTLTKATADSGANMINGRPWGVSFGWRGSGQSVFWLANASKGYGNRASGIEKWVSADGGANYTPTTWTVQDVDYYAASVTAHPNGSWLISGRLTGTNTFTMFDKETGLTAPGPNSGKAMYNLDPAFTPNRNTVIVVAADYFGNVAINADNSDFSSAGVSVGMVTFPDSGSSDTRIAGTFPHTFSPFKPTVQAGAAFTPASIPGNNSTTSTLSASVVDKNGLGDPSLALTGTVTIFGTAYPLTVTKVDASHFNISATVKAPAAQKCGVFSGIIYLEDNSTTPKPNNNGIADPPQYANLTVTGGTISGTVKLDYSATERGTMNSGFFLRVKDKAVPGGAKDYTFTIPASAKGAYSVSVHAGNFLVTADTNSGNPAQAGYDQGKAIDNVAVTLNNDTAGVDAGVAPLTIYKAKALDPGAPMALKGIVDAEKADTVNGYPGFPAQYYLRDASLPGGGFDGIPVVDTNANNFPIEKSTVIYEGTILHPNGSALYASNTVSFYTLSNPIESDYGAPTPCVVTDFNNMPGGAIDPGWGRLYKVSGVTWVSTDTANNTFLVKDASNNQGMIDCFTSNGISVSDQALTDLFAGGATKLDIVGIKDLYAAWVNNALRPRRMSDITASPVIPTEYDYTTGSAGFVKFGKWNLISLPADPVNSDPLAVFNGIGVADASFQFWKNDVDGGGYQLYGSTFGWTGPATRGTPYWFIETGTGTDKDVTYKGSIPTADFIKQVPVHAAAPYWIMFGTPSQVQIPSMDIKDGTGAVTSPGIAFKNVAKRGDVWLSWTDAFSEADSTQRIVDSNAQGWDTANSRFSSVTPPAYFGESSMFNPWWGYWMLVYDTNPLEIKFPTPPNPAL